MVFGLSFPRGGERDYIATIGIAAVFVASVEGGGCIVRSSRDLEASQRGLRGRWPGLTIVEAWWLADQEAAEQLARRVRRRLPKGQDGCLDADPRQGGAAMAVQVGLDGLAVTAHELSPSG
jgi:hypothetical protein